MEETKATQATGMKVRLTSRGKAPIEIHQGKFSIGGGKENDLVFPWLSKEHCTIFVDGNTVWLIEHGSDHGTSVNGTQIAKTPEPVIKLKDGDKFKIGKNTAGFIVRIEPSPAPN